MFTFNLLDALDPQLLRLAILIYYTLNQVSTRFQLFETVPQWERRFVAYATLIPLPFALVPTLLGKLGPEQGLLWCWIAEADTQWKFVCLYGHLVFIIS